MAESWRNPSWSVEPSAGLCNTPGKYGWCRCFRLIGRIPREGRLGHL